MSGVRLIPVLQNLVLGGDHVDIGVGTWGGKAHVFNRS